MGDTREPFDDLFEPVAGEPTPPPAQVQTVPCPSCGTHNPATNRHCVSCGARVAQGPLPMAPQPLVRSTAGSRALIVTAVVIAVVAVIAFFYNAFVDDEASPTTVANGTATTTSSTTAGNGGTPSEAIQLTANRVVPSAQLSGFPADNLIDSDPLTMWQVGQEGVGATLTLFFPEPVALQRIEFKNLTDETKFLQNFRARGVRISTDDTTRPTIVELANTRDVQPVAIQTDLTNWVRIEVTSTYPAEAVGDQQPFKELAVEDLKFFGSEVAGDNG